MCACDQRPAARTVAHGAQWSGVVRAETGVAVGAAPARSPVPRSALALCRARRVPPVGRNRHAAERVRGRRPGRPSAQARHHRPPAGARRLSQVAHGQGGLCVGRRRSDLSRPMVAGRRRLDLQMVCADGVGHAQTSLGRHGGLGRALGRTPRARRRVHIWRFERRSPHEPPGGEYDAWDDDARGDARGLLDVLWDVAIQRACIATVADIDVRRIRRTILVACRHGRADLIDDRTVTRWPFDVECWTAAAEAADPCCFARLLDLAAAGHLDPMPPATLDIPMGWLRAAVLKGRWRLLALLDARGIAFDAAAAFALAASHGRMGLAQWLWARAQKEPTSGGAPLDARGAIANALGSTFAAPHTAVAMVAWLCETCLGGGSYDDLAQCIDGTGDGIRTPLWPAVALYAGRRWPRAFLDARGPDGVEGMFRLCVSNRSLRDLASLLAVLDASGGRGDSWDRPCDLWDALATLCARDGSHFAYAPMLAVMRLARAASLGVAPRVADVALLDGAYNREAAAPCSCVGDPLWRHRDGSAVSKRRCVDSDPGPCEDARIVASLTPLARWCRPRPVSLARVLPGWTPERALDEVDSMSSESNFVAHLKSDVVAWLAQEGLLLAAAC